LTYKRASASRRLSVPALSVVRRASSVFPRLRRSLFALCGESLQTVSASYSELPIHRVAWLAPPLQLFPVPHTLPSLALTLAMQVIQDSQACMRPKTRDRLKTSAIYPSICGSEKQIRSGKVTFLYPYTVTSYLSAPSSGPGASSYLVIHRRNSLSSPSLSDALQGTLFLYQSANISGAGRQKFSEFIFAILEENRDHARKVVVAWNRGWCTAMGQKN
jgi:hypothetical protein